MSTSCGDGQTGDRNQKSLDMVTLLKVKGNDGRSLTVNDVLAMPQHVRQDKITKSMAEQLGLVYIDGAGGPQFVGTKEEQEARMSSARRAR
ncbi:MAG TPA: hypothetical protein VJH55_03110 [Candidatus Paceibacterota bacterium]